MSDMLAGSINPSMGTRQYPKVGNLCAPVVGYDGAMPYDPIKTGRIIRTARKTRGPKFSQEALAKESGVSQSAISDIERGARKDITAEALTLLRFFHLPVPGGSGDDHIESSDVAAGFGSVAARLLTGTPELEMRAGMGGGGVVSVEVRSGGVAADPVKPDRWHFPPGFIRDELRAVPAGVIIAETQGDSMVPTLYPGDRVLIDTGHRRPSPDGVYALRDQFGGLIVKRLHALAKKGQFSIISDNPAHPPREAKGGDLDDDIVGRVVGAIKRL